MPSSPAFRQTASLTAGLSTVCSRGYAIRRESVSFPRKVWRKQAAAFKKTVEGLNAGMRTYHKQKTLSRSRCAGQRDAF
jgi:hypothetical protein